MTKQEKIAMVHEAHERYRVISDYERDRLLADIEADPDISFERLVELISGVPRDEWNQ